MRMLVAAVHLSALALTACAAPPPTAPADDSPAGRLASMTWLEGRWAGPSPAGLWTATYTSPAGGELLGVTKEFKADSGGQATFVEFERFQVQGDTVILWPFPQARRTAPFTLVELDPTNRRAAFENPQHDFPQRLEYWRADDDTLVIKARKLEKVDGKFPGFVLALKRIGD